MLNDSKTARMVYDALPITGEANLWGDEIYFDVDFPAEEENGKLTVELGDIALVAGRPALCIFLGKPRSAAATKSARPAWSTSSARLTISQHFTAS